jgi:diguanylate cyclase (GGDEF)-like protein
VLERLLNLPVRVRLGIAFASAILPFVALFIYADVFYYRPLAEEMSTLSSQVESRFSTVNRLQLTLTRAAMPPNDYLIHGGVEERRRFELIAAEVEAIFAELTETLGQDHPYEANKLAVLKQRWAIARDLGTTILHWPSTDWSSPEVIGSMQFFDAELDRLAAEADALLAHVRADLRDSWRKTAGRHADLKRMLGLAALLAMLLAVLLATYVSRTILRPLRDLEAGAHRFASGRLDQRIGLDQDDEFGYLAKAMNEMASRLGMRDRDRSEAPRHDPVTRLWNRALFTRRLDRETERSLNDDTPLSLLLLGVDNYAEIVDRHGQAVADEALKAIADRLRHVIRHADCPGRYAQDELAVMMPGTGPEEAEEIAGRLRRHLAGLPVKTGGAEVAVRISVGVAGERADAPHRGYGPSLAVRAEQSLLHARQAERKPPPHPPRGPAG